jgi:hypothetical protein
MRASIVVLGLAVAVGSLAGTHAAAAEGGPPRLEVLGSARTGEWIKLKVRLVSDAGTKLEFAPKDLYLEMPDGSRLGEWRWETFFPEASANLKKGDRISSVGTAIGDKILGLSSVVLIEGSTATITVPLAPGAAQEAVLYFQAKSGGKPVRLKLGSLSTAEMK